jgi:hypothetical protein
MTELDTVDQVVITFFEFRLQFEGDGSKILTTPSPVPASSTVENPGPPDGSTVGSRNFSSSMWSMLQLGIAKHPK